MSRSVQSRHAWAERSFSLLHPVFPLASGAAVDVVSNKTPGACAGVGGPKLKTERGAPLDRSILRFDSRIDRPLAPVYTHTLLWRESSARDHPKPPISPESHQPPAPTSGERTQPTPPRPHAHHVASTDFYRPSPTRAKPNMLVADPLVVFPSPRPHTALPPIHPRSVQPGAVQGGLPRLASYGGQPSLFFEHAGGGPPAGASWFWPCPHSRTEKRTRDGRRSRRSGSGPLILCDLRSFGRAGSPRSGWGWGRHGASEQGLQASQGGVSRAHASQRRRRRRPQGIIARVWEGPRRPAECGSRAPD